MKNAIEFIENDLPELLAGFDEYADEIEESSIRILVYSCALNIHKKAKARGWRAAHEDAQILVKALEILAKRSAQ